MIFDATKRFLRDVLLPTAIVVVLSTAVITIICLAFVGITVVIIVSAQELPPAVLPYIAAIPASVTVATILTVPYIIMRMKWKSEGWKEAVIQAYVPWNALSLGTYALFSF